MLVFGCQKQASDITGWKLIFQTNRDGTPKYGSKEELINSIRKGSPIRVGWHSRRRNDTTKSVEHFLDATFITIANGDEVFAQLQPFLAQRPDLTSDTLSMTLIPNQMNWILGTNGTISSVGLNYEKDTATAYDPSPFRYEIGWYVQN